MANILVAEDNTDLRDLYCRALTASGYHAYGAEDGNAAVDVIAKVPIDLVIADIMMPGMNGYELTDFLRKARYAVPVMMITSTDDFNSMTEGFAVGADDYMVKPVNINEMLLRIKALLRRAKINAERKIKIGSTIISYESMTVNYNDKETELPLKEFQLLYKLLSYPNKIFTREQIMDEIWGFETDSDPRTLNTHIHRLRDRFADNPDFEIVTIRGLGYKAVKKNGK